MLRNRVIPVVLLDGYSVVKTIRFKERRNLGSPITVARIYNRRNVDELMLLDIDASKNGDKIDEMTVEEVASECFMPLSVGGGLQNCADIANILSKGADKVVLNTSALKSLSFVKEAADMFGSQCIVASVDVLKKADNYTVFSHSGVPVNFGLIDWINKLEEAGIGELVINSVDNDGVMCGYDYELITLVSNIVSVPIIALGGVQEPTDAVNGVKAGASAIAAASIFHFTDYTPNDLKLAMNEANIPVRL